MEDLLCVSNMSLTTNVSNVYITMSLNENEAACHHVCEKILYMK